MTTPWPDDVLDCAKRLAKSLGYFAGHILTDNGRVYVNYPTWSSRWRPLDPRDPTVWSALIGKDKVKKLSYWQNGVYLASLFHIKAFTTLEKGPGMAVCEAYNILKGNKKCTTLK